MKVLILHIIVYRSDSPERFSLRKWSKSSKLLIARMIQNTHYLEHMRRDTWEIHDRNYFIILLSYLYKLRIFITRYNYTFNAIHINLIMDTSKSKFNLPLAFFLNKFKINNFSFISLFLKKKSRSLLKKHCQLYVVSLCQWDLYCSKARRSESPNLSIFFLSSLSS